MKKVLIIGTNGLVGQAITNYLQKINKYEIIACSLSRNINNSLQCKFEVLDITNFSHTNYIISLYKPDVVINTAAISSIDECKKNKTACINVNYNAVKNLSDFCRNNNIHFIHFSTDFVFQGTKQFYDENDIPEPVNFYGQTKLMAENELITNNKNSTILRVELVYGFFKNMKRQNIVTWVINSLSENKPIKVVSDQYRTPTYNYDIAKIIPEIIENKHFGIFNIGGDKRYSIYEIAIKTADVFELDKKLITPVLTSDLNENELRPKDTSFNINYSKTILSYNPNNLTANLNIIKNELTRN